MEDINSEFGQTDVVLVLGRTTWSTRPPRTTQVADRRHAHPGSLQGAHGDREQRSMASGYAGLDNELFYGPHHDGVRRRQKVLEDMVKAVE